MPIPAKLRAPGWYRAALFDVLGFAFAFGLTVLVRALMHELVPNAVARDTAAFTSVAAGLAMPGVTEAAITG